MRQKGAKRDFTGSHVHSVEAVISVSNHLKSAKQNLDLAKDDSRIRPAFGYHPEQSLPTDSQITDLHRIYSVTPDVVYEKEIQRLVKAFPITQLMVETDGPWAFEGEFKGQRTHPKMMQQSIATIAALKQVQLEQVYQTIFDNTYRFYGL